MNNTNIPIKVIRLKTSEDIIAFLEEDKKYTTLYAPMSFTIDYDTESLKSNLYIDYWLPISVIENNIITIPNSDILYVTEPKKDFKKYYLNLIQSPKSNNDNYQEDLMNINDISINDTIH